MNPYKETPKLAPLKNLVQYVEFFESCIQELLQLGSTELTLNSRKCINLLSVAPLIKYHHQKMNEQNICEDSLLTSMDIQDSKKATFYKSVIIPMNYKMLGWISLKILRAKHGVRFIGILKVYHQNYASKEEFSNLIVAFVEKLDDQNQKCLETMLINANPKAICFQHEANLLASKLSFCPLEELIAKIIAFLKLNSEEIQLEHILHIVNSRHKVSFVTLTVLCEMLIDFTKLDGAVVWKKLFKILEIQNESSLHLLLISFKIELFYESVCSFLKSYLKSLTVVRLSDYELDFVFNSKVLSGDFKMFSQIELSKVVFLVQFLISDKSPVQTDFSNQLFQDFELSKELADYLPRLFRNFEL